MDRREMVLSVLAAADGKKYTPVQLQKSLFLICENLPSVVDPVQRFSFRAYDYGPFDDAVYRVIEVLEGESMAESSLGPNGRWKEYSATDAGVVEGQRVLDSLPQSTKKYVVDVSNWVRTQTFSGLVKSIYEKYPDMQVNSIFQS